MERRDGEARKPAQRARPCIASQIEHPQPPRYKENTCFGRHLKARPREHPPEGAPRIRLLEAVPIQPEPVQQHHQERAQEGVPAIRYPDDYAAARTHDAKNLPHSAVRVREVLNRTHGVDRVEAPGLERERPHIGQHTVQRQAPFFEVPGGRHGRSRVRYRPRRRDSRLRRPSAECACSSPHPRDRSSELRSPSSGAR